MAGEPSDTPSVDKSNLNIKYGDKAGTWDNSNKTAPTNSSASNTTAGNIYAAKNSIGEIEMYLDTPIDNNHSTTARKRLDPRIYVGSVNDIIGNTTGLTQEQINQKKAAATNNIWNNYDVWIDTSGSPTGTATTTTDGLMSSTNVTDINDLKDDMATVKTKINGLIEALQGLNIAIKRGPWNNSMGANNTLTIVMPNDWAGTEVTFNPDGNVDKFTTTGGNGS